MSQAIRLDPPRPNTTCGICLEDFSAEQEQWNHQGGSGHAPFHKDCLKNWVAINPTCPLDRDPIDRNSFLPTTKRTFELAMSVLMNSTLAAAVTPTILAITLVGGAVPVTMILDTPESLQTIALAGTLGAGLELGFGTLRRGVVAATAVFERITHSINAVLPAGVKETLKAGEMEIAKGVLSGLVAAGSLIFYNQRPTIWQVLQDITVPSGITSGLVTGIATWWKHQGN